MKLDAADAIEALQAEVERLKDSNEELRERQTFIDHYGTEWMTSAKDVPTAAYEHGYADGRDEAKAQMPMTQFVRFSMDVIGADGIEVKYPFGWVSAPHLVNLESIPERMEYLMGFVDFYEDFISFNGDTQVIPIEYVQNGHFSTLESVEIPDFSNGKEYFTDAGFSKLLEWCEEYKRRMDEGNSDDDEDGNTVR